jgi:hypothetical protein
MHPSLRVVTGRFPDIKERAVHLFERDEDFHDLCEEYGACAEAMSRLETTGSAEGLRREYAALLLRLEHELLRYVEELPNG